MACPPRSVALVAVRIEVVVDVGYNHVCHTRTVAQLVYGLVGYALVESAEFPSCLSIVEQHLFNLEYRLVGCTV